MAKRSGDTESARLTEREYALIGLCQLRASRLQSVHAQRHLTLGFQRRLLLNQASRLHLEAVASVARTDVLSTYACAELNVHLNSFFIQIRGGLDNLAWVLHYELQLLGVADESDQATQRKCGLFSGAFLSKLATHRPELAAFLKSKAAWFHAFKERRDPVAHRLPLFAVPGVIREGSPEAMRAAQLQQEILEARVNNDFERLRAALFEAMDTGTYEPWFMQYGLAGYEVRDIRSQVHADCDYMLTAAENVLASVLA
jgi:hypothetical protein